MPSGPDRNAEKPLGPAGLQGIYGRRFSEDDAGAKGRIWREIGAFLQRFVPPDGRVIDIACDRGDFIRHVRAAEKWATDIRPVGDLLPSDVRFVQTDGLDLLKAVPPAYFDLAFMSNYLEHLSSPDAVIRQLEVVARMLRPGGRVLVLQPNVRLVGGRYWDFIDHRVALTERSLEEAAGLAGFKTVQMITRFLPFTTKSRVPQHPALVRAYLAFRPAWLLLGKQTLYLGQVQVDE
jgi:SAM-dependent methyltransferase